MSLKCALKILQEKELIKIIARGKGHVGGFKTCPYYEISSKNHELIKRIHKEISEDSDYIYSKISTEYNGSFTCSEFKIVKVETVDKWLENSCKEEETRIIKCENFIENYIFDHTDYRQTSDCNGYMIINRKVREERIKKEKEKNKKAIELFESML